MPPMAPPEGKDPSFFGRRAKAILSLGVVLIIHVVLLGALLNAKASPLITAASATEISLIPGLGAWSLAVTSQHPIKPPTPPPVIGPETAQTPKPTGQLTDPATPTPAPMVQARTDLEPLITSFAKGGPTLTTEPITPSTLSAATTTPFLQKAGGNGCQIAAAVQAGLQGSAAVRTALAIIPAGSRSVANAIVLWNGRWIDPSAVGGTTAFEPVVKAVVGAVNQSSSACQAEVIHGVRFIILADAQNTTVLAFGSGEWRWRDLIATFSTTL